MSRPDGAAGGGNAGADVFWGRFGAASGRALEESFRLTGSALGHIRDHDEDRREFTLHSGSESARRESTRREST